MITPNNIPLRVPHLVSKRLGDRRRQAVTIRFRQTEMFAIRSVMRAPRQAKKDAQAWPVTVRVIVPVGGFHSLGCECDVHRWLDREVGRGEFATSPRRSVIGDVFEAHFRTVEMAQRFRDAFPMLHLADETESPLWRSPDHPAGRNG